jgi:hypothetical protein
MFNIHVRHSDGENALVVRPHQGNVIWYTHTLLVETNNLLVCKWGDVNNSTYAVKHGDKERTEGPNLGDSSDIRPVENFGENLTLIGDDLLQQLDILTRRQRL